MEEEIQKEVEARMRFKFNEIFTSLKNHSNAFRAQVSAGGVPQALWGGCFVGLGPAADCHADKLRDAVDCVFVCRIDGG